MPQIKSHSELPVSTIMVNKYHYCIVTNIENTRRDRMLYCMTFYIYIYIYILHCTLSPVWNIRKIQFRSTNSDLGFRPSKKGQHCFGNITLHPINALSVMLVNIRDLAKCIKGFQVKPSLLDFRPKGSRMSIIPGQSNLLAFHTSGWHLFACFLNQIILAGKLMSCKTGYRLRKQG